MPPNAAPMEYASSFVFTSGDAHRHGSDLVLAQRHPRPAEPGVAQAQVDEQDDEQMATISQYHGLRSMQVELADPGKDG